ncbi:MAG: FIST C-terminal domain-containing protein, partial [Treponema sp.]|nr:FIST C-terminal domain-containing protein [Treponema sp.]
MIRTLSASTDNIDDLEAAVKDIKAQLGLDRNLLKNAVGIAACHYEFAESGTLKAICDAMPFEICGTISSAQGTERGAETLFFTLLVLTSDTVSFKTALSGSLAEKPAQAIEECYRAAAEAERPALVFTFAPFMVANSGDDYVIALSKVSGGAPCFGTLAIDDTADFHECFMLYGGEHYQDRMSLILVYGEFHPQFYLATISREKILEQSARITSSEGHLLKEVNGRPVAEFFAGMGLTKASEAAYAMTSLPFMLDYNDGTPPVSRAFIGLNENQHAICAGAMPEGSTLKIGVSDKDDVLLTSGQALEKALEETPEPSGLLIYSCISRGMTLGSEILTEMALIREKTGGKIPLLQAYSGGEICPTQLN